MIAGEAGFCGEAWCKCVRPASLVALCLPADAASSCPKIIVVLAGHRGHWRPETDGLSET